MNKTNRAYMYFNKSNELTIGIFSNDTSLDKLKQLWDTLGDGPYDHNSLCFSSEMGWMKGFYTGDRYNWKQTDDNIEIHN